MKCECGFKFSGPGEFRNCEAFTKTSDGQSGVICPTCGKTYVGEQEVIFEEQIEQQERKD